MVSLYLLFVFLCTCDCVSDREESSDITFPETKDCSVIKNK
jgi:hypothetical protein